MTATLRLTREGPMLIELRRGQFDITVDGTAVGSIDNHQTVDTPVQPGSHTLSMRKGRYASRSQPFEVADGEVVTFRCHGASIWPTYVASIFAPKMAISLKRD